MLTIDAVRQAEPAIKTEPATKSAPGNRTGRARTRPLPEMRKRAVERRQIEQELKTTIEQEGFVLHYQTRFTLDQGRLVGAEALIRWPHRKRGLLAPAGFIPAAEDCGLISPIGDWVLRTACAEALHWPDLPGGLAPTLSVNVSASQLRDDVLLTQVAEALESTGLSPERLELDLTESLLTGVDLETLLTLSAIRDLGVGLAIDDFGGGYASLSMLKRLPLTVLKLDRSLVREAPHDVEDAAITRALVETGHAMGMIVVAEGVESETQRAFLTGIGCDQAQGFLFSHPLPADALRERLADPRPPDPRARVLA